MPIATSIDLDKYISYSRMHGTSMRAHSNVEVEFNPETKALGTACPHLGLQVFGGTWSTQLVCAGGVASKLQKSPSEEGITALTQVATEESEIHQPHGPSSRTVFESLIGLALVISLMRGFVAEAFMVPTGSMAPSLLGYHARITCPNCDRDVVVGSDSGGHLEGMPVCANCNRGLQADGLPMVPGDRLLVQNWLYDYRLPKRWETIVFFCPDQPRQPYVKRVVGLPGESVQIKQGNIWIDGRLARKSLEEMESMALPVFEHYRQKEDSVSRWAKSEDSGWNIDDAAIAYHPKDKKQPVKEDPLVYQHRDSLENVGSVDDRTEYTLSRPLWDRTAVSDLLIRCKIRMEKNGVLRILLHPVGTREFNLVIDCQESILLLRWNTETVRQLSFPPDFFSSVRDLAFGYFDERVVVRLDSEKEMEPFDLPDPSSELGAANSTPLAMAAYGGNVTISDFRILRDVHYSDRIASTYKPAGVLKPYKLAMDQYFVLGDNSAISNDSRAWKHPGVPAKLLMGKPLFVHLPSLSWQTELFGKRIRRPFPDIRKIRRIH